MFPFGGTCYDRFLFRIPWNRVCNKRIGHTKFVLDVGECTGFDCCIYLAANGLIKNDTLHSDANAVP